MAAKVYTISPSAPFADTLARGLIRQLDGGALALADAVIYLPTRRAQRTFGDAFARVLGGAALLPQFKALGDAEEDEFLFGEDDLDLPPAIAPMRRTLLLAALVREWHRAARGEDMGFAQAAALGEGLARVLDDVETQGARLSALDDLVPAALAEHWENVRGFLRLLETEWPKILTAEGCISPADRRNRSLHAIAKRLKNAPSRGPVIAAGSTGSIPATAELLKTIAELPHSAVILPGLDRELDAASWNAIDPGHPQYGMKQLLERLDVRREDVGDWDGGHDTAREYLLREALRPAPTTDAWRAIAESDAARVVEAGLSGLSLIAAADPSEEALAIALALRETLDTPGRTATLVTPDRGLARRVASELRRWDIEVDDSAGRPLSHTTPGAFLCLVAEAARAQFAPVELLALLKHPLATLGGDAAAFRARARDLDRALRGPKPDSGLAGLLWSIAKKRDAAKPADAARWSQLHDWFLTVRDALAPLEFAVAQSEAALSAVVEAHVAAGEALAGKPDLWSGNAGEAAATFVRELRDAAGELGAIGAGAYAALFRKLAQTKAVRPQRGGHPRATILGPLEARLQSFDTVVIGGLNEGTWPTAPGADPWFSRPMRAALGLEQPERAIGQAAHDFAMLSSAPRVVLTRSRKADGAPTVASRWLQRLSQLSGGLGFADRLKPAEDYVALAQALRDAGPPQRMAKPAPAPPLAARPKGLPVTDIETWVRDPYAIYAKRILRLRVLDPLDAPVGPLERGTAIHRAMELFVSRHPGPLAPDAALQLIAIAERVFEDQAIPKATLAVWRPRFAGAAYWFVEMERERRAEIRASHVEIAGTLDIADNFTLEARADRIDIFNDGAAAIIDYKSGGIPAEKQIKAFLAPQLPLEAAILNGGGFKDVGPRAVHELSYVRLSGGRERGEWRPVRLDTIAETLARLKQRVADFSDPVSAYLPRVQPLRANIVGDYDHLSRVREWSVSGWNEDAP